MTDEDVEKLIADIEKEIHKKHAADLIRLAAANLPRERIAQPVNVHLQLDAAGKVVRHTILMGRKEHPKYQEALGKLIGPWQFPFVKKPGACTVTLQPWKILIKPIKPPDIHMFEMAPLPRRVPLERPKR